MSPAAKTSCPLGDINSHLPITRLRQSHCPAPTAQPARRDRRQSYGKRSNKVTIRTPWGIQSKSHRRTPSTTWVLELSRARSPVWQLRCGGITGHIQHQKFSVWLNMSRNTTGTSLTSMCSSTSKEMTQATARRSSRARTGQYRYTSESPK